MKESNTENKEEDVLILARERQIINEVLEQGIDPALLPVQASRLLQKLTSLGDSLPAALLASLQHPQPMSRVLAAWLLLKIGEQAPATAIPPTSTKRAQTVIIDALKQTEYTLTLFACVNLSNGGVPVAAIPLLIDLLTHSDAALPLYSAAALTWCGESAAQGLAILTQSLCLENEVLASVAANALARLGVKRKEAAIALVRRLADAPSSHQYSVLLALRDIGEYGKAAGPTLGKIAGNAQAKSLIRAAAAEALGSVCLNDDAVRKKLTKLLDGNDWEVSEGALRGLIRNGSVSPETLGRIRDFLASENCDFRRIAARGIQQLGETAVPLLRELVQALCQEADREVQMELASACAALGQISVEPLCDIVQSGKIQFLGAAALAFMLLGRVAAEGVAERLLNDADDAVRWAGVSILRGLGPDSEPAIPALMKLLPTVNDERAIYILLMFGSWGDRALAALPAVTDCLLERKGQVAEIAGNVLVAFGNGATSYLEQRVVDVTDDNCQRIQGVLARIHPKVQRTFERLLTLNADKDLLLFVFVGAVLEEAGPIGLRKVALALESQELVMLMKLPTSEAAIREMLGELSRRLQISITKSTTRGILITDEGRGLWHEAQAYLPWRGYALTRSSK